MISLFCVAGRSEDARLGGFVRGHQSVHGVGAGQERRVLERHHHRRPRRDQPTPPTQQVSSHRVGSGHGR